jgi:toxin ParE1/3/4
VGKSARYEVVVTAGAEEDLRSLYDYLAEFDSPAKAGQVLDRLLQLAEDLAELPERGAAPRELAELGIRDFRQGIVKPYRLIYRVIGRKVVIYLVADGRRNRQALLTRRLLGA